MGFKVCEGTPTLLSYATKTAPKLKGEHASAPLSGS